VTTIQAIRQPEVFIGNLVLPTDPLALKRVPSLLQLLQGLSSFPPKRAALAAPGMREHQTTRAAC
jgi:hypothetical protein